MKVLIRLLNIILIRKIIIIIIILKITVKIIIMNIAILMNLKVGRSPGQNVNKCKYCGRKHEFNKYICPAFD